jgi:hypothetical protein
MKHTNLEFPCPSCSQKLKLAHPYLQKWFEQVKRRHPEAHISCAWRGQEAQDLAFKEKRSQLPFPLSKHNRVDADGKPCALALDLFELSDDGLAIFNPKWFARINAENEEDRARIRWGGTFGFKDFCHYELLDSVLEPV